MVLQYQSKIKIEDDNKVRKVVSHTRDIFDNLPVVMGLLGGRDLLGGRSHCSRLDF